MDDIIFIYVVILKHYIILFLFLFFFELYIHINIILFIEKLLLKHYINIFLFLSTIHSKNNWKDHFLIYLKHPYYFLLLL